MSPGRQTQAQKLLGRRVVFAHQADQVLDHAPFDLGVIHRVLLGGVGVKVKEQSPEGV